MNKNWCTNTEPNKQYRYIKSNLHMIRTAIWHTQQMPHNKQNAMPCRHCRWASISTKLAGLVYCVWTQCHSSFLLKRWPNDDAIYQAFAFDPIDLNIYAWSARYTFLNNVSKSIAFAFWGRHNTTRTTSLLNIMLKYWVSRKDGPKIIKYLYIKNKKIFSFIL